MVLIGHNMRLRGRSLMVKCLLYILLVAIYCEYFIYYLVILQCSWPTISAKYSGVQVPVYTMFFADTHLLGKRNGHWFDKLRREWQMHRAFQSAMTLHAPQYVFILGDVFDEGLWCSGVEFNEYVDRFHSLFSVPKDTQMFVAVGNHDIGFHYRVTPYLSERFVSRMKSPAVQMISMNGNHFVLLNSMAMEGDGCFLCHEAESALKNISTQLQCMKGTELANCHNYKNLGKYSRPILLQHFPLYRISDEMCTESDAAPFPDKKSRFRERWECLSRESTEFLIDTLQPRVVLGGHTHHACYVTHTVSEDVKIIEYSVPSFSWRNRNDPSFMLGVFTPDEYKISKCKMPRESTVINTYILCGVILVLYLCVQLKRSGHQSHSTYRKLY